MLEVGQSADERRIPHARRAVRCAPIAFAIIVALVAGQAGTASGAAAPRQTALTIAGTATPTRYVATWGSDANSGRLGSPWRTLQKAADSVRAGTTVFIHAGSYRGFVVRHSGTRSAPIVFKRFPGDRRPVVTGRANVPDVIRMTTVHDIVISGLEVTGARAAREGAGILVEYGSYRIRLADNDLHHNRSYGISIYRSTQVQMVGNEIRRNATGILVARRGGGVRIVGNRIHDNDRMVVNTSSVGGDDRGAVGVAFVHTTGSIEATGNRLWANRARSYDYGWDGGAFEIYAASNVRMLKNRMWDNENVLETGTDGTLPCDDNVFARNVAYGATTRGRSFGMFLRCGAGMKVANNTFDRLERFVFSIGDSSDQFSGSIRNLKVANNIVVMRSGEIYGLVSPLPASVRIDRNILHTSGYIASVFGHGSTASLGTFRRWTGYEQTGLTRDPRFISAANRNFHLRADSPAINRGMLIPGITDSYAGAAPDIGRYERRS